MRASLDLPRTRVRPPFDGPGVAGAAFARAVGEIAALRRRERIDSPLVGRTAQGFDADQFACDEGKALGLVEGFGPDSVRRTELFKVDI